MFEIPFAVLVKRSSNPQVYLIRSGNQMRSLWAGDVALVFVDVYSSRKTMNLEASQIHSVSYSWLLGVMKVI